MDKKCIRYEKGHVGYPRIAPLGRDQCVVADWTGQLTVVDLIAKRVLDRVFVGAMEGRACSTLRSLDVTATTPRMAAAATRGGYAAVYDLDRKRLEKVYPQGGGTVNSVAFSRDGRFLAIGTGFYALSSDRQPPRIELWAPKEGSPEYLNFVALPGVCVDSIAWTADGDLIACSTGMLSQNHGFIAQLDAQSLRPVSFFETSWATSDRLSYLDAEGISGSLAVCVHGGIRVLNPADGVESWREDQGDESDRIHDFTYDAEREEVVLTNGAVVDAFDGSRSRALTPMKDCTSIAVRPGGGYLGASSRGAICRWE